jgi:protein tyrosine phosphatase (PTP) superfamily phosphohydrolase (DUF442 family)
MVRSLSPIRRSSIVGLALSIALTEVGCAASAASSSTAATSQGTKARPAHWAFPVERPGLPNFHKVSDDLYRGAQPEPDGLRQLSTLGVRTIVNLRHLHSDRDEIAVANLTGRIGYERIAMTAWEPSRTPVFVHCQHGADRTGMMVAMYRVVVQGWSKADAIDEMRRGGFGFHPIWRVLPQYVRDVKVDVLRVSLGPQLLARDEQQ